MRHGRGNGHTRVNGYAARWTEIAAAHRFHLELADENHCDAYATEETPVVPAGTPVEIKACKEWIGNGSTPAGTDTRMRGRFTFSPTHGGLLGEDGWYALVVYDTVGDPEASDGCIVVERMNMIHAKVVEKQINDDAKYPKLGWPHVFSDAP